MRRLIIVAVLLVIALTACSRVAPGYQGIMVNTLGENKGEMYQVTTGRYWVGPRKELHVFPTFNQNYVWTQDAQEGSPNDESFTFPVDGLVVGLDVGIEYSLEPDRIIDIFTTYRRGVNELTDVTIRKAVRDSINDLASEYDMDSLVEQGASALVDAAFEEVRDYFAPQGIIIHSLSLVSAPRYPDSVVRSIEAKIEATQRAVQRENELREAQAEAAKQVAQAQGQADSLLISATAEAEANRIKTASLTTQIIQMEWIQKWNGQLPEVATDSGMFVQLPAR